mgnify:CR=1 FL=1
MLALDNMIRLINATQNYQHLLMRPPSNNPSLTLTHQLQDLAPITQKTQETSTPKNYHKRTAILNQKSKDSKPNLQSFKNNITAKFKLACSLKSKRLGKSK